MRPRSPASGRPAPGGSRRRPAPPCLADARPRVGVGGPCEPGRRMVGRPQLRCQWPAGYGVVMKRSAPPPLRPRGDDDCTTPRAANWHGEGDAAGNVHDTVRPRPWREPIPATRKPASCTPGPECLTRGRISRERKPNGLARKPLDCERKPDRPARDLHDADAEPKSPAVRSRNLARKPPASHASRKTLRPQGPEPCARRFLPCPQAGKPRARPCGGSRKPASLARTSSEVPRAKRLALRPRRDGRRAGLSASRAKVSTWRARTIAWPNEAHPDSRQACRRPERSTTDRARPEASPATCRESCARRLSPSSRPARAFAEGER